MVFFRPNFNWKNNIIVIYILLIDIFVLIVRPHSTGSLHQLPEVYLNSFDFDHLHPSTARESPPSIIKSDKCVVKKVPGVAYVARPEVREDGSNYDA